MLFSKWSQLPLHQRARLAEYNDCHVDSLLHRPCCLPYGISILSGVRPCLNTCLYKVLSNTDSFYIIRTERDKLSCRKLGQLNYPATCACSFYADPIRSEQDTHANLTTIPINLERTRKDRDQWFSSIYLPRTNLRSSCLLRL